MRNMRTINVRFGACLDAQEAEKVNLPGVAFGRFFVLKVATIMGFPPFEEPWRIIEWRSGTHVSKAMTRRGAITRAANRLKKNGRTKFFRAVHKMINEQGLANGACTDRPGAK